MSNARVLAVDLGKTGCRLTLHAPEGVREGEGPGVVGLAGVDGVRQVESAVERAARDAGLGSDDRVDVVSIGLVGYHAAASLREELGRRLARRWAGIVVLASDVTTTHVGAFDGGPGVVMAAGTGAVALALDEDGRSAIRDGWGFLLGDDGSGYAVGRAGLRAALSQVEGRAGGSAALAEKAQARWGELVSVPAVVHGDEHPARVVASFARDVLAAAQEGDEIARQIWIDAGRALAETALAAREAVGAELPVSLAGGLAGAGEILTESFAAAVGSGVQAAVGSSLDGARRLGELVLGDGIPTHLRELLTVVESAGAPAGSGLGRLATEGAREDLLDLDQRSTADVLRELWTAEATVPTALLTLVPEVAEVVDEVADRLAAGGRMFYVGAGTPGRLAYVDAGELPPTFGTDPELVQALTAGGTKALLRAAEGAEDDADAGERAVLDADVGAGDVVVGLTASGRTPFVISALQAAKARGALTVGMSGNAGAEVSGFADHAIEVVTGPEVISGSTRLMAGTAQKLFLNALSTATMIRLGKTYGPYMVDMRATNHKLRHRAIRMVTRVTGCSADEAERALEQADWSTKVAIVTLLRSVSPADARGLLEDNRGSVRAALEVEA
ncbi:N-acetylmuramic acid 6-phosphate etherase [Ornithinimicrobium sp. Y1847]|uniref:N-acetylmuramic acid 6-phosphate etherase n=1 Tax=Ornithinimicrobium sp. Y1847 TaxID=3405419 RepID=UPI003B67DFA4